MREQLISRLSGARSTESAAIGRGLLRVLPSIGCTVLAPVAARASDPVSDFQYDPVEHWAARALIWALLISLIMVVYLIIRAGRGKLVGGKANGLLVVGVIILPSVSVATGMVLVFSRAEKVEFCASCHGVMQDYVDDMTDPAGTGMAALHYAERYIPANQCYECHTSFGLFGTMKAKIHGVEEVLRYYTGRYSKPVEMWQPYSNADCLKCHAGSRSWIAEEAHTYEEAKTALFRDQVSCMECHEAGHQVATLWEEPS
jgi:nitrate/TMAO reductase-like tetraheme cytochrome c subunit